MAGHPNTRRSLARGIGALIKEMNPRVSAASANDTGEIIAKLITGAAECTADAGISFTDVVDPANHTENQVAVAALIYFKQVFRVA